MNKNQLNKVKKDIKKVLDKKNIRIENYLGDCGEGTESNIFIKAANGNTVLGILYSIIKEKNEQVTLEVDIDYMPTETNVRPIFTDAQIIKMMELTNLINRQALNSLFFVNLAEKSVCLKNNIYFINGRLSTAELEKSIDELFNNAGLYYPLIMESINSNEPLDMGYEMQWVCSSYLHKECRAEMQKKTETRELS